LRPPILKYYFCKSKNIKMSNKEQSMIPEENIQSKIYLIRGMKVMLDRDLAALYGVETKRLKEAIRRNLLRFPEDFMFELTDEEFKQWRSQFIISDSDKMGLRYPPFAFTEHGVLMLASVLNSERAIQVNIQIVRVYNKMREMILTHKDLFIELENIKKQLSEHDEKILIVFEYLKQFEKSKQEELEYKNRPKIGFKRTDKK
jgi:phage regulator Rha-like protein